MASAGVNIHPFNSGSVRIYGDPRTTSSRNADEYTRFPLTQESTSFVTSVRPPSNGKITSERLAKNYANYEQSYPVQSSDADKSSNRKASLGEIATTRPKQTCTTFRQPTTRKSGVIRIDARDYSQGLDANVPRSVMTLPRAILPTNNYTGTATMAVQKSSTKAGYIQRNPCKTSLYAPASISHTIAMTAALPVTTTAALNDMSCLSAYAGAESMRRQNSTTNIGVPEGYEYTIAGNGGKMRRSQPTTLSREDTVVYSKAYADTLLYQTPTKNSNQVSDVGASQHPGGINNKTFSDCSISASTKEPIPLNGQYATLDAHQENSKNMKKSSSLEQTRPKSESKSKDMASYKQHQKPPKDIIAKDKKRKLGRKTCCCMFILTGLLITAIIFVIFLATNYYNLKADKQSKEIVLAPKNPVPTEARPFSRKGNPTTTTIKATQSIPDMKERFCLTPDCIKAAGLVLQKMNKSVDPCEDFYEYSCGGWIRNTYIPPEKMIKYGVVQEIETSNEKLIYEVLMRPNEASEISADMKWSSEGTNITVAERKAKLFFKSCLDIVSINRLGRKPMSDMIANMGGWDTLGNWNRDSWSLDQMLYSLQGEHNVNVFFFMRMPRVGNNETRNVLRLEADGITIPDAGFYVNDRISKEVSAVATAYKRLIRNILALLGGRDIERVVEDIYNFEKRLAMMINQRNSDETLLTIQQLQELCPQINWYILLQRIFKKQGLTHATEVIVNSRVYMKNLSSLLANANSRSIRNYMLWRAVVSTAGSLSTPFRRTMSDFSKVLHGPVQDPPLWKQCMNEVRKHFGVAVGALFVRESFNTGSKREVEIMVKTIQKSFRSNLGSLEWIDEKTKRAAIRKLNGMSTEVGYPEELFGDPEGLDNEYKFSVGINTYFKNIRNSIKHKISQSVDKLLISRWTTRSAFPQTINAFYSSELNKAFFPAGLLQSPLFGVNSPRAINFGGIGTTIGHEITHGYDMSGQQYDVQGKYRPWWSDTTKSQYNDKARCLVDHYSKYSIGDNFVDGSNTLHENIADIAGLKVSYMGYKRWLSSFGNNDETTKQLPGLELTDDQLFFVGYAQMWCTKSRKSRDSYRWQFLQTHSPEKFRVLGGVSQSEEFAKTFKCAPDAPMNPSNRCRLW